MLLTFIVLCIIYERYFIFGWFLFLLWTGFAVRKCWHYDKIIVNSNSLTFCNFIKNKNIPFEDIRNTYLGISWNRITVRRRYFYIITISCPKTIDGIIKIVQLSDYIRDKDSYIEEIKKKTEFFWLGMVL